MNKFLKLVIVPTIFMIAGATTSCAVSPKEIALITDIGDIDDGSFNQESWEACKEYATKNHKSLDFYRPFNDSEFARNCAVKQAVAKGAQIVVLPGFKFANTCESQSKKYPNVHFLLIDSRFTRSKENPVDNVCSVGFKCEYSGFIAGYTVARDLMERDWNDNEKLRDTYGYAYCGGMASPGVYEFGYGFIQGICVSTKMFVEEHSSEIIPQINIFYNYAQVYAQDDNATARIKGWLNGDKDIKVIFPCGGKLYQSATEAVQHYNRHQTIFNYDDWLNGSTKEAPREAARWIGVDSDQYRGLKYDYELKTIYTSALKGLKKAIIHSLDLHYLDRWTDIGGYRDERDGDETHGQIGKDGQWILGLNSLFGDNQSEDKRDDFVGIPVDDYDQESKIIRGFHNYTLDEYNEFRELLIEPGASGYINVYGGDGTEYGAEMGIPEGIVDWGDGKFRETYLGNYPHDKIWVKVV